MTEKVKLNEITDIYLGVTHTPEYVLDGVPFLSVKDISGGKICFDECKFISQKEYNSLSEGAKPKVGDMLFCRVGTIGKPIIIPEGTPLFGSFVSLGYLRNKAKDRCNLNYLRYWMYSNSFWKQVNKNVKGASQVNLNTGWLSNFEITLPDFSEQTYIASILDKCKLIIERREEELKKFDNLIKARFVEMFGNPVRNSKNWNTEKLCSIAPINKYNGDIDTVNGKVWLLNLDMIESCTGNIVDFLYEFENRITSSTIKFDENCVLYSKLRPYLNKVVIPERKGYATSELVSMSTEKINKYFLANLLRQDSFVNFSNATAYGAKMPRASMDLIKNFDVINPPTELQNKFGKLVIEVEKSKLITYYHLKSIYTKPQLCCKMVIVNDFLNTKRF